MRTEMVTNNDDDLEPKTENFFKSLQKNLPLALLAFLTPLIISWLLAVNTPVVYQSKMLVRVDGFSAKEFAYLCNNLSEAVSQNDYSRLSQQYKFEHGHLGLLKSLQCEKVKDRKESFIISIQVNDTIVIKPIEKTITKYFQNNLYLKRMVSMKRKIYLSSLDTIQRELLEINKLKLLAYEKNLNPEVIPYFIKALNSSYIQLREEELNLKLEIEKTTGFTIIEGFAVPDKPKTNVLKKHLIFGAGMGLLCVAFLITEIVPRLKRKT